MKYNQYKDPIRIYNEILGGKWRLLILYQLFQKTQRFKDLTINIEGITPRMLTKELRTLERFNLVEKEVYREVPPRVEYSLSDEGVRLYPLIESIINFGTNFAYLLEPTPILGVESHDDSSLYIDEESMKEVVNETEHFSEMDPRILVLSDLDSFEEQASSDDRDFQEENHFLDVSEVYSDRSQNESNLKEFDDNVNPSVLDLERLDRSPIDPDEPIRIQEIEPGVIDEPIVIKDHPSKGAQQSKMNKKLHISNQTNVIQLELF
ncbi:MAG: winged helix-turn-helix transcriptional regulator [Chitinophagales bacterium]